MAATEQQAGEANQFEDAAGECVLQQPGTVAFVQGRELGKGLLSVDERWTVGSSHLGSYWDSGEQTRGQLLIVKQ